MYSGIQSFPSIIRQVHSSQKPIGSHDDDITPTPDPQKRAAYDRHGSDPEDRTAGMAPGRGFATSPFGGGGGTTFQAEMSPEDLFNMFFGGGGGMGPFGDGLGGGPGTLCQPTDTSTIFYDFFVQCLLHHSDQAVSVQRVFEPMGVQAKQTWRLTPRAPC
jgi:hypothetical protein